MHPFEHRERFDCSPETAYYCTTRDFEGLENYIPNITRIRVREHEFLPDGRERWLLQLSGDGAVPAIALPVIKPDMLRIDEELHCDPQNLTVEWKITPYFFTEHYHCSGIARMTPTPTGSEITLKGTLHISLTHIDGLPDALVIRGVQILEPFLVRMAKQNLHKFYDACRARLAADPSYEAHQLIFNEKTT